MDANREAAREVLRRCMAAEFAAVGAENEPDAPSPVFEARMEKLLRQEQRPARNRGRSLLVAAAIVATCLVLAAWTPVGGMVRSLLVTAGGQSVNYRLDPGMRLEIERLYVPAELPEGFEELYAERWDDYCCKTVWVNGAGVELEFWQLATDGINGSVWGEDFTADTREVGGRKVLFVRPDESAGTIRSMAYWSQDGYLMELICRGDLAAEELETVILSVQPAE